MWDMVGKHFTVRESHYGWRRACTEFRKRMDPELLFSTIHLLMIDFMRVLTPISTLLTLSVPPNGILGSKGSAGENSPVT